MGAVISPRDRVLEARDGPQHRPQRRPYHRSIDQCTRQQAVVVQAQAEREQAAVRR